MNIEKCYKNKCFFNVNNKLLANLSELNKTKFFSNN